MKMSLLKIVLSSAVFLMTGLSLATVSNMQWGCYSTLGQDHACRNFSYDEFSCQTAPPQYGCQWGEQDNSQSRCQSFCDGESGTPQARQNCVGYSDSIYSCVEKAPAVFGCYWATTCNHGEFGL